MIVFGGNYNFTCILANCVNNFILGYTYNRVFVLNPILSDPVILCKFGVIILREKNVTPSGNRTLALD